MSSSGDTEFKDILLFFDTDENASPFDILTAYDAGFDEVVPYENIKVEKVEKLVRDAIYPRGPEGVKHTSFLIGGSSPEVVARTLEEIKETMFHPFEASVVVDPRGANTTGSALVAKLEKILLDNYDERFEGEDVLVLAGTGPVGRIVARLCASECANVVITSRVEDRARRIARDISNGCEFNVQGIRAANDEEVVRAINNCDLVVSSGPEGVRIVSESVLKNIEDVKVMADLNTTPPTGIQNLDPSLDGDEFMDGIIGLGGLALGNFKSWLEREILSLANDRDSGLFDYEMAFEMAKEELF